MTTVAENRETVQNHPYATAHVRAGHAVSDTPSGATVCADCAMEVQRYDFTRPARESVQIIWYRYIYQNGDIFTCEVLLSPLENVSDIVRRWVEGGDAINVLDWELREFHTPAF